MNNKNEPKFKVGAEVQKVSDSTKVGVVVEIDCFHGGIWYYRVSFGGERKIVPEPDLIPYLPESKPSDILKIGKLGNYDEFQRNIVYQKLSKVNILTNNIYAFNVSRTIFYPYQFKPLLKFLESSNNRILIADEVGLGKTIEAGLIYMELKARQKLHRVLVVCPSGLKEKWKTELENRFGEEFSLLSSSDLIKFMDKYIDFQSRAHLKGIIALESIRQDNVLEKLQEVAPDFDLVIIDEAHHMRNVETRQHRVGKILGQNTESMAMLSATPVHLASEDLFRLLNILDEDNFSSLPIAEELFTKNEPVIKAQACISGIPANIGKAIEYIKDTEDYLKNANKPYLYSLCQDVLDKMSLLKERGINDPNYRRNLIEIQREVSELNIFGHIFNRTRKREVKEKIVSRRSYPIKIQLSDLEREFYNAVLHFVKMEARKRSNSAFIRQWLICTPLRRVTSCMSAMVEYYRRNLGCDETDIGDDDYVTELENGKGSNTGLAEAQDRLKTVIRSWGGTKEDSKFRKFKEVIDSIKAKEGRCKIMVFAFFKDTLRYLKTQLDASGYKTILITGDTPHEERYGLIDKFRGDTSIEILLSSRVGSEGLDFQFCDTMVNYDLPWNPMEVEQRIGRLDRIGQRSSIIRIYNFYIEETIEERILDRLYERIGIFEKSIGELEPIIGEEINILVSELISKDLDPQEETQRIERSARIIENKRQELERLEKKSSQFIGVDNFFDEEIDRIRRTKRYITSEQLIKFVFDFLKHSCPRTRIEYDDKVKNGKFYPDSRFQSLITEYGKSSELPNFFSEDGVRVTFDSDFAFQNSEVEFINSTHALVNLVIEFYKNRELKFNNAYHIILKSDKVKPGQYFYFVFRLRITAAKESNTLEAMFIDQELNAVCVDEDSEILLGEMLENGKNAELNSFDIDSEFADKAYRISKSLFMDRLESVRKQAERNNNLLIEGRIASIKMAHEKRISQKQRQLDKGKTEAKDKRYIIMLESEIRRLTKELESAVADEESKRTVSVEYDEVAAGILEISS